MTQLELDTYEILISNETNLTEVEAEIIKSRLIMWFYDTDINLN